MPKKRRKTVANENEVTNRGGRPRLPSLEQIAARLDDSISSPAPAPSPPPAPAQPRPRVSWSTPLVTVTKQFRPECAELADPPMFNYAALQVEFAEIAAKHARKKYLLMEGLSRPSCTCRERGRPGLGDPCFTEHDMFCRHFECYAYEGPNSFPERGGAASRTIHRQKRVLKTLLPMYGFMGQR